MNSASPTQLRKCLEMSQALIKSKIRFVCIPVKDDEHEQELFIQADSTFMILISESEKEEKLPVNHNGNHPNFDNDEIPT